MDPRKHEHVSRLFVEISDLAPASRDEALDHIDDAEVRAEVESLLEAERSTPAALQSGELPAFGTEERAPDRVGAFRILDEIGRGGMGVVYRAEQEHPVRRPVALKLLRRSLHSERAISRFELECQAMAALKHSGIAHIYAAGVADDGRPYLAMELVSGQPITDYCDAKGLDIRARIRLMLEVCGAVRHAHQNALIHRDIKPSNVLVAENTGGARPKVIDFGVVKPLGNAVVEEGLQTVAGELLFTPHYMSPEQATLDVSNVDTRTDVYGLGLLLYELLCGRRPFDLPDASTSFDDVRRIIREREPTPPSRYRRVLRGDLDAIVLRALEKDPDRRYGSAEELAADLERFLVGEPVVARRAGRLYRLRRFLEKRKLATAVVAGALVTLVSFTAFVVRQNARLVEERALADRQTLAAQLSRTFAFRLFELLREDLAPDARQELVQQSLAELDDSLGEAPDLRAEFLGALFDGWQECRAEEACSLIRRSLFDMIRQGDSSSPKFREVRDEFAQHLLGGAELRLAEPLMADMVRDRAAIHGPFAPETARARRQMSALHFRRHRFEQARRQLEALLADDRRYLGDDHSETIAVMGQLGGLYVQIGELDDGQHLLRAVLASGMTGSIADAARFNLACARIGQGHHTEGLSLLREALLNGFYYVSNDENGSPVYLRDGLIRSEHLQPVLDHPDFVEILGEEGYMTLVWRASDVLWEGDYAEGSEIFRRAVAGGLPAEHALRRAQGFLQDNPDLREHPGFSRILAELRKERSIP